ncbi:hypothetical protein C8J57DRAFT_1240356 [Mycena rebaudengoi]|nr:hypothetical protein C8J57DRAFT_1240356 [Mycena rebaudengoi]
MHRHFAERLFLLLCCSSNLNPPESQRTVAKTYIGDVIVVWPSWSISGLRRKVATLFPAVKQAASTCGRMIGHQFIVRTPIISLPTSYSAWDRFLSMHIRWHSTRSPTVTATLNLYRIMLNTPRHEVEPDPFGTGSDSWYSQDSLSPTTSPESSPSKRSKFGSLRGILHLHIPQRSIDHEIGMLLERQPESTTPSSGKAVSPSLEKLILPTLNFQPFDGSYDRPNDNRRARVHFMEDSDSSEDSSPISGSSDIADATQDVGST